MGAPGEGGLHRRRRTWPQWVDEEETTEADNHAEGESCSPRWRVPSEMQIKLASTIRNAACGGAGQRARGPEEAGGGATEGPLRRATTAGLEQLTTAGGGRVGVRP
jgi:hypothetical protein